MVLEIFRGMSPIMQALTATLFTWFVTGLGAAVVFFFKDVNRKFLDSMLGFAAGVMIAASFWSLLSPAIETSENMGVPGWIPAVVGFLLGGLFLRFVDHTLPHLHPALEHSEPEGVKTNLQRSVLLVLAVTLHNIPEGLAVGIAFGAVAFDIPSASLTGAIALAVGIGIQNFPEGAAVSIPLKREGLSNWKSFMYGQSSGIVEPLAGVVGAMLVMTMRPILPYALSFAAGAMIFVVGEELIPEANSEGNSHLATGGLMAGFAVMMFLDVALG